MYLIPKELNSKIKIARHLNLKEFILFIAGMGIVFLFSSVVAQDLTIPYYIFSFLAIGYLLMPAKNNPGKDNYQAIYYLLVRNKNVFHAISESDKCCIQEEKNEKISETDKKKFKNVSKHKIIKINNLQKNKEIRKSKIKTNLAADENINKNLKEGVVVSYNFKGKIFNKNKVFYIHNISKNNLEGYEVLDPEDITLLRVNNAMNIKINNKSDAVLNLDKNYKLGSGNVIKIKGSLNKDIVNRITDTINFLKENGYIAS